MLESQTSPWTKTTFGEIARRLVNGGTPPTEIEAFWKGDIPWITGADFNASGIGEFRRFVSQDAATQTATNVIDQGELLLVTRTGVGKLAIAPCDIAISQDITGVYPDRDKVDVEFLFHRMRQGVEDLKKLNQGTSINGIVRKDLLSYSIELPPIPQQKRIAEILSTVDEAIEQTEALIAKTQRIKAGLMHDLFTRGVMPDGRLRPPREEAPQLYKESPLGWIPKEWDVYRLSELCSAEITYGIVQAGPHIEGGVPYIRTGDMSGDRLVRESLLCTSEKIAQTYERSKVRAGEIVFAIRATVGKVLPVPTELDGANLTQGTARIAPNSRTSAAFLLWNLRTERTQSAVTALIKGTTFNEITLANLRWLQLAVPVDVAEMKVIASRLEACANMISTDKAYLEKLRQLKKGLMHDLLTGHVRIPVDAAKPKEANG